MSTITTETTVGQLVAQRPDRSRVFEQLGIDYCCGGKKTLAEACAAKGLDAATVLTVMLAAEAPNGNVRPPIDCQGMTLSALADHIEQTHHTYLRRELPRLATLVNKVAAVHGPSDPRLQQCAVIYAGLVEEMHSHMMKEEQILFPMIRELEGATSLPSFHCGSVTHPITVMEHEHDSAGAAVAKLRELTDGFTPPQEACNTYRAMLDALAYLENDLHQHVHKENNILFPRAAELEQSLATAGAH